MRLQQAGGQGIGNLRHCYPHAGHMVERGQPQVVGQALGDGPRHAHALAPQAQVAVTEAATVQRRTLAVKPALVPTLSPEAGEQGGAPAGAFSTITSNSRSDILSSFLEGLLHNAYHGSCEFQVAGFENLSHRIALHQGTASAVP